MVGVGPGGEESSGKGQVGGGGGRVKECGRKRWV